ncbi:hypothetical protein MACK_000340 [Theileria orientalis]|uniref:J domain-containing protein n=1 Tax=Theileria orientalis TaxID=68886 RepID=A0A976M9P4_THEOR|nr:hypothetical protein MACK_000340 [Theileria orientalis]
MFTKVLVPLDSLYPYPVNLDSFRKEYNLTRSYSSNRVLDQFDTRPNVLNEHTNHLNRNNPNVESSGKGFNISKFSKNFKIDSLMSKFSSLRGSEERRHTNYVWVYANLDDPIRIIDNKIYIKVYLCNKSDNFSHDNQNNTGDNTSTTTKYDSGIDRVFATSKAKPESRVVTYDSVSPSDRDEINEMIDKWSLTSDGKLKDIRSLLSTLQNVLLDDVVWEPMPLSLLVGDKYSIKQYYKKALLTFHPDKVGSKSTKNRLLSELIIQTLINSWNCTT